VRSRRARNGGAKEKRRTRQRSSQYNGVSGKEILWCIDRRINSRSRTVEASKSLFIPLSFSPFRLQTLTTLSSLPAATKLESSLNLTLVTPSPPSWNVYAHTLGNVTRLSTSAPSHLGDKVDSSRVVAAVGGAPSLSRFRESRTFWTSRLTSKDRKLTG
jgi:hypothetical protein